MGQESTPAFIGPMDVMRLFHEANMDVWAQAMSGLISQETFAQTLSSFLDTYLTSSASLQKIFDYYMGVWLSSVNMPSREDILRLERQLVTFSSALPDDATDPQRQLPAPPDTSAMEARIATLDSRTSEMMRLIQEQAARHSETTSARQQRDAHLQTLDERTDHISSTLHDYLNDYTSTQEQHSAQLQTLEERTAQIASSLQNQAGVRQERVSQLQALEERTSQIAQTLDAQAAAPPPAPDSSATQKIAALETHLQTLDTRTNQIVQMLEKHAAQSAPPPEAPVVDTSALEEHIQSLAEKTEQILHTLASLQEQVAAMETAGALAQKSTPKKAAPKKSTPKKSTSTQTSTKEATIEPPVPELPTPEPPDSPQ